MYEKCSKGEDEEAEPEPQGDCEYNCINSPLVIKELGMRNYLDNLIDPIAI